MAKTIKQIADEIGVTKQAVYKRFKGKLNTLCAPYAHTEDGILYLDEQGEQIIKNDFAKNYYSNRDKLERSNGAVIGAVEHSNGLPVGVPKNDSLNVEYVSEIEFLHRQIDRLQDELEKEREHNREKDRQLLDTLSKLAETQAALAAGQNAEKQKALAEKLIEGQQMVDEERKEQIEPIANVDESKKRGLLQRIWTAITNK